MKQTTQLYLPEYKIRISTVTLINPNSNSQHKVFLRLVLLLTNKVLGKSHKHSLKMDFKELFKCNLRLLHRKICL